jgi:hypothetical protein
MMAISWWVGALAMTSGFLPSLDKFCSKAQMRCKRADDAQDLPLMRLRPNALGQSGSNGLHGWRRRKYQAPELPALAP